jgi:hypothetical protein
MTTSLIVHIPRIHTEHKEPFKDFKLRVNSILNVALAYNMKIVNQDEYDNLSKFDCSAFIEITSFRLPIYNFLKDITKFGPFFVHLELSLCATSSGDTLVIEREAHGNPK